MLRTRTENHHLVAAAVAAGSAPPVRRPRASPRLSPSPPGYRFVPSPASAAGPAAPSPSCRPRSASPPLSDS